MGTGLNSFAMAQYKGADQDQLLKGKDFDAMKAKMYRIGVGDRMAKQGELAMQVSPLSSLSDATAVSNRHGSYALKAICRSKRLGKEEARTMLGTRQAARGKGGEIPRWDTAAFRFFLCKWISTMNIRCIYVENIEQTNIKSTVLT